MSVADMFPCSGLCVKCWGVGLLEHVGEVEPECELVWVWGLHVCEL